LGVIEEDDPCPCSDYFLVRFAIPHSEIEVAAMFCTNAHRHVALQNVAIERLGFKYNGQIGHQHHLGDIEGIQESPIGFIDVTDEGLITHMISQIDIIDQDMDFGSEVEPLRQDYRELFHDPP